jgi:Uma2 family endonuclease
MWKNITIMTTNNKETKVYEERDERFSLVCEPDAIYELQGNGKLYSYADCLSWTNERMREIIDGVVRFFSAPLRVHVKIAYNIGYKLGECIKKNKGQCHVYMAPFDVRLPKNGETADDKIDTVLQPDICVVCDLSKLDDKGCLGAPDIVIEIQSPSTAHYDMTKKFVAYENAGVPEYWIVFPLTGITIFHLQEDGKYDAGTPYIYDAIVKSQVLEGFEVGLKELFSDL